MEMLHILINVGGSAMYYEDIAKFYEFCDKEGLSYDFDSVKVYKQSKYKIRREN